MREPLLVDTDIIIDHLRGYTPATNFFLETKSTSLVLSAMTIAELYAGIRNQHEQSVTENFLSIFQIISIDDEIAITGGNFRKKYRNSHGTGLMDAIIAATAIHHHATVVTLNTRHFPMVKTIKPYEK